MITIGLTFTTEDQPDLTLPEDSIHQARLMEVSLKTINWQDRGEAKTRDILEWWWEVTSTGLGDQYIGRKVKGTTPARLTNHPNNKFRIWAETLLDREIPVGMSLDVDDLVGLSADISIGHRADKTEAGKVWEFVDEVFASSAGVSDEPPF